MLEYKGYRGKVEYISEERIFHGEVLGTRDVITFQGSTADEIEQAFRDSIDDYLEFCQQRGEEADKPYSGKFVVRMPETLHRHVADLARLENESINNVVLEAVKRYVARALGDDDVHE
ncbi:type II toxin-antitoxin system HicB family antitoxin [bacterium]|nr:type II toxin-antitoxin system HicB family antitoxin [bacterium]